MKPDYDLSTGKQTHARTPLLIEGTRRKFLDFFHHTGNTT